MVQWFSSDLHLGHRNIIKFCDRPFADEHEMDEAIIGKHNIFVKPQDHWTCLGDVSMGRGGRADQDEFIALIKRFNGHKRLILGNHDQFPIKTYIEAGFEKIYAVHMIDKMRFSHIPIHPDSMGSAEANIHGHIHQQPSPPPATWRHPRTGTLFVKPYVNISVEQTNYRPVSLEEIKVLVTGAQNKYAQV